MCYNLTKNIIEVEKEIDQALTVRFYADLLLDVMSPIVNSRMGDP